MFKNRRHSGHKGHLPGDSNAPENIVTLTPREHLISHMFLCKIYRSTKYEYQCLSSLLIMLNGGGKGSKRSINRQILRESMGKAKLYAIFKAKAIYALSKMYR